ncbi:MAG: hypothetical protein P8103_03915 [Candidatus Thiodiazotropha sp.]
MEFKPHSFCNAVDPLRVLIHQISVFLLIALLGFATIPCSAASRIELVDGTEINGEVVSMSNGRYIIRSPSLGQIELPQSSVRAIEQAGGTAQANSANADIQAIQQQILTSPELMQLVTAMMSDPEILEAIKDPEFVQLIMSGDLVALQKDPRIHRLMNNPSVKAIVGKMQAR